MFQTETTQINDEILDAKRDAETNYIIQKNDQLDLKVYSNKGELLIDANKELQKQLTSNMGSNSIMNGADQTFYVVQDSGMIKLPMIGVVSLDGCTQYQADSILSERYNEFYVDCYAVTKVLNRRVFVFGTAGGIGSVNGMVIPLKNENMSVIEVLAIAGGLDRISKSHNIKLIRGDLNEPNVYVLDLSTVEGMKKANLNVQPNDIIYVERQRKLVLQTLTELSPLISLVTTTLTLVLLVTTL